MPGDVGELFVRVRPDTAGFTEEADAGTANAGRSLAKVFVAAFAAVGVGEIIKHTVEAAVQQQQQFAILNKTVSNAGAANEVHGQSIDNLVKQQAALKGFSVADISTALGKLESVTRNSAAAFKLLGAAENLSRGTGKDLTVSALAVQKAYEGSATSLARYGIIIKPVTTDVDRLKAGWAKLRDEGVQFSAQQTAQQAVLLRGATLQDKLLTGQEAIAAIQQRFGGESAAYAKTAAGQLDRLGVSVHELEVTIGNELLPTIAAGAADVAKWVDELASSASVQHDAAAAGHDLSAAFHDVEDVAKAVAPILGDIASAAAEVVHAVGAPALLAAGAAYAAIKIGAAGAAAAQGAYNAVIAAGLPEKAKDVSETEALTAAIIENTAALRGQAIAAGEGQLAIDGLARAEVTAGAAGDEAAAGGLAAFGDGLVALATGPGAIVLGLSALAAGIVYLSTQESAWTSANNAAKSSLENLTAATQQQEQAVGKYAKAAAARNEAAAAAAAVAAAERQGAAATAQTLPQLPYGIPVRNENAVLEEQRIERQRLELQTGKNVAAEKTYIDQIEQEILTYQKSNPLLAHNLSLLADLASELRRVPPNVDIQLLINNKDPQATLIGILSGLDTINAALEQALAPARASKVDISGALKIAAQALKTDIQTGGSHSALTEAAKLAVEQLAQGIALATDQQANLNQQMVDAVEQGAIAVQQAVQQAKQNFDTIGQDLAGSINQYLTEPLTIAGNAYQAAADRISLAQQELTTKFIGENARLAASQNAISLRGAELALREERGGIALPGGHTLSTNNTQAIRQLEALLRTTTSPAGKAALQQYIDQFETDINAVTAATIAKRSEQSPQAAQRAGNIALRQEQLRGAQDRATIEEETAKTSLATWTQEFIDKRITLQRFNTDVKGLLRRDIGSLGNVAKEPGGYALEQQIRADITGFALQARALAAGPQQPGSGLIPSIVHPLQTLQQEQRQIASIAQQQRTTANTIAQDSKQILQKIYGAEGNRPGLQSLAKNPPTRAQVRAALSGIGVG